MSESKVTQSCFIDYDGVEVHGEAYKPNRFSVDSTYCVILKTIDLPFHTWDTPEALSLRDARDNHITSIVLRVHADKVRFP